MMEILTLLPLIFCPVMAERTDFASERGIAAIAEWSFTTILPISAG